MTRIEFPRLAPAEILALEEALLDAAEAGITGETLAFWESAQPFIVLGCGNKVATETRPAVCAARGVPILRRGSGGGTVLQGPGVLNYSLVLRLAEDSPLATIHGANEFIMQRNAAALTKLLSAERGARNGEPETRNPEPAVRVQGHTDLALAGRKFSGNAQRRKRTHLLFHGTVLRAMDWALLDAVLPPPSLQPDYRQGRAHQDFLRLFPAPADAVKAALAQAWGADSSRTLDDAWPGWRSAVAQLVSEKYGRDEWNLRI